MMQLQASPSLALLLRTEPPPPTDEQIERLQALGYRVEDMGKVHGAAWMGQFRWLRTDTDQFQDSGTSDSLFDAWASALDHAKGLWL